MGGEHTHTQLCAVSVVLAGSAQCVSMWKPSGPCAGPEVTLCFQPRGVANAKLVGGGGVLLPEGAEPVGRVCV